MKVTSLPDVEPRPARARRDRHVRRRAPRASRGDPRRRHGAHVRSAPAGGHPPGGPAEAAHTVPGQARPDRRARGGGAGRDPVRPRLLARRPPRSSSSDGADRPARRRAGLGGRELPLRQAARGATSSCCARAPEFETRVVPLVEVAGETVSSSHIRGLVAAGEVGAGGASSSAGRSCSRARSWQGDKRGRELGMPDRQPRARRRARRARATASTRRGRTATPAAVNVGVRPTFDTGRGAADRGAT